MVNFLNSFCSTSHQHLTWLSSPAFLSKEPSVLPRPPMLLFSHYLNGHSFSVSGWDPLFFPDVVAPPAQCLALFSMYIHPLGDYMLNNGLRYYLYAPNPSWSLILTYPASYLISLSEYLTRTSNLTSQIHAS